MIREIVDGRECEQVLARARSFMGTDEQYLAPDWLARDGVFCVPQLNVLNGFHTDTAGLEQAFASVPHSRWYAVKTLGRERVWEPVELTDPVRDLTDRFGTSKLHPFYSAVSFVLFSADLDLVILYAPVHEFRLVAGCAVFVRAYIESAKVDPVTELRDALEEEVEWARQAANEEWESGLLETQNMAFSQMKLPPPPPPGEDLARP